MFHNILVLVDGSPHAQRALGEAIDLSSCSNARLTILTAVPHPSAWATMPATAGALEELEPALERKYEQILAAAVESVPQSIPVTKILTYKPIRYVLHDLIEEGEYDLVVMGSRGRGALAASVLGSVSHYALNHRPIALMILHDPKHANAAAPQAELVVGGAT
jgi:nucleotide-binding universal stress UspA family protein